MDSLTVMDMMMELEEKFDVSIPLSVVPRSTPSTSSRKPSSITAPGVNGPVRSHSGAVAAYRDVAPSGANPFQ